MVDGSFALAVALGHLRDAATAFLSADDPTGESLFLAAECRDLEAWFVELGVTPARLEPAADAAASLDAASAALAAGQSFVPLGLWAGLQSLRARSAR